MKKYMASVLIVVVSLYTGACFSSSASNSGSLDTLIKKEQSVFNEFEAARKLGISAEMTAQNIDQARIKYTEVLYKVNLYDAKSEKERKKLKVLKKIVYAGSNMIADEARAVRLYALRNPTGYQNKAYKLIDKNIKFLRSARKKLISEL